jgi:uncharacterized protein YukE
MTSRPFDGLGFEVEPAALRGAAGSFDSEADELVEIGRKLDQYLANLGACWGADEVGLRFASAYSPAAATVLGNLTALSTGLQRIGAALRSVADNYERVDQLIPTQAESRFP